MKILQPHALAVEAIHVRGFQMWMAVGGDVAVAVIIGHDEDDVGLGGCSGEESQKEKNDGFHERDRLT